VSLSDGRKRKSALPGLGPERLQIAPFAYPMLTLCGKVTRAAGVIH